MDREFGYAKGRDATRLYITKQFTYGGLDARHMRRVFPTDDLLDPLKERDRVVLRSTGTGLQQVQALVLEENLEDPPPLDFRDGASMRSALPISGDCVVLRGQEIARLIEFLVKIGVVGLPTASGYTLDFDRLAYVPDQWKDAIKNKPEMIEEILRTTVTPKDVKALAFRRDQLEKFRKFMETPEELSQEAERLGKRRKEDVWQAFFEANQWIFGYGLSYVSMTSVDEVRGRLENVI